MKNPFKKFYVTEDVTVVYDTYKEGSYTRNKSVKVPKGTIVYGDKIIQGDKELVSVDAKDLGVNELISIPADKVEKVTPWGVIITCVVVIVGSIVYYVKHKK